MAYKGHLLQTLYLGIPANHTIAASMAGTAAATQIMSSASFNHASSIRVFNLTLRNVELIVGGGTTPGTVDFTPGAAGATATVVNSRVLFIPGTASAAAHGMGFINEMPISQGVPLWVRTTENTPVTCASVTPLIIQFWA